MSALDGTAALDLCVRTKNGDDDALSLSISTATDNHLCPRTSLQIMDSSALLLSVLSGILGAGIFFFIREIVLIPSRTKEQRRRKQVQRKLEKLYSPLFMLTKYHDFIIRDKEGPNLTYISDPISSKPQGGVDRGKRDLDSIILNYGYLADDDELMRFLPQILGPGFYDARNKEMAPRMVDLIERGYARLRKEYFAE